MQPLDVTGLTFDDVAAELAPRPGDLRALRAQYRRLLRGESKGEPDLVLSLLPVALRVEAEGLTKLAFRTADGHAIESVVVPMQHSQRHWKSVCVSSQIGCARGCRFCETGSRGLVRNLTAAEIAAQVIYAGQQFGSEIRTVVFMGMGEPFDNFDTVIQAVRVLTDRSGLAVSRARITLSTAGVTRGIQRLAALGWKRINLAVSLNAPNDILRAELMPIARVEPLPRLLEALLAYPLRPNQHIMIEYVLIPGVNDHRSHALELAQLLEPVRCMVNVIPHNPRRHSPFPVPTDTQVREFLDCLKAAGQPCRQRVTRGREELAACGQLGACV